MKNVQQPDAILLILEKLWGFLPEGADFRRTGFYGEMDVSKTTPEQRRVLGRYKQSLMGMTGGLIAMLVIPRLWMMLICCFVIGWCWVERKRCLNELQASLPRDRSHKVQGDISIGRGSWLVYGNHQDGTVSEYKRCETEEEAQDFAQSLFPDRLRNEPADIVQVHVRYSPIADKTGA